MTDDPYAQERAEAVELAHKAMASSYIGAPPPRLRGDAERMVAALVKAGWTPPSVGIDEYTVTGVWRQTFRRRVIVVEDWREVTSG